jgi:hypothetical protein
MDEGLGIARQLGTLVSNIDCLFTVGGKTDCSRVRVYYNLSEQRQASVCEFGAPVAGESCRDSAAQV